MNKRKIMIGLMRGHQHHVTCGFNILNTCFTWLKLEKDTWQQAPGQESTNFKMISQNGIQDSRLDRLAA